MNLPGLVIVDGALTEFNASLTSSFTVAGLVISVDDMAMSYASKNYEMYGTVSVSTANVQFSGTIGQPSASPPIYGLVINDNVLKNLAITINSNVTFGSLTVQAQNLSFNYDASPESFTLYGTVTTSIAGVTLQGNLGTQSLPGLTIVNGQLTELNLGVTANFSLFDLQCNVQDLTFQYQTTNGNTDYILYGGLTLAVSGNTFSATLGTSTNPGLIIQNGVVEQINMSISGSFQISGFGFEIDDAGLDYTATNDEYLIFGTFTLSDVFSASVQLGTGSSNPGITIINGVFELDQFAFSLDNVPIGALHAELRRHQLRLHGRRLVGGGLGHVPDGLGDRREHDVRRRQPRRHQPLVQRGHVVGHRDPRHGDVRYLHLGQPPEPRRAREHHRLRLDRRRVRQADQYRRHVVRRLRRDGLVHRGLAATRTLGLLLRRGLRDQRQVEWNPWNGNRKRRPRLGRRRLHREHEREPLRRHLQDQRERRVRRLGRFRHHRHRVGQRPRRGALHRG